MHINAGIVPAARGLPKIGPLIKHKVDLTEFPCRTGFLGISAEADPGDPTRSHGPRPADQFA